MRHKASPGDVLICTRPEDQIVYLVMAATEEMPSVMTTYVMVRLLFVEDDSINIDYEWAWHDTSHEVRRLGR